LFVLVDREQAIEVVGRWGSRRTPRRWRCRAARRRRAGLDCMWVAVKESAGRRCPLGDRGACGVRDTPADRAL